MKLPIVLALTVALSVSAFAQATARQALNPLYKQGVLQPRPQPNLARPAAAAPAAAPANAAKPAAQAAAIEPDLKASPINLFGKIDGLAGTFFVTNIGNRVVAPFAQLAVLDKNGKTIGWVTNSADALQPKESAKIQVLATNANAVELKLVRLIGHK